MGVFFSFFMFLGTKRSKQLARGERKILESTRKGDELEIEIKNDYFASLPSRVDSVTTKLCNTDASLIVNSLSFTLLIKKMIVKKFQERTL